MSSARKHIAAIWIGLALVLGACQPSTPVKIPQATLPLRTPTATLLPADTPTPLPQGFPTLSDPAPVFHSSNPATWIEAIAEEPKTLDPALSYETTGGNILAQIYDPLITYKDGDPLEFIPALAEEVPSRENGGISPDGLVYTFTIRARVQFHDGTLLTAGDVAYSFQRGLLQGGTSSPQWLLTEAILGAGVDDVAMLVDALYPPYDDRARLSSYTARQLAAVCEQVKDAIRADEDRRTVTFRLKQPWSPFLATLPGSWGSVTSRAWVKDHGGWDGDCATWQNYYAPGVEENLSRGPGRAAMGSGPYRLDHWTPGEELVLAANRDYWRNDRGAPKLQKIVLRKVADFSTRLDLLRAGKVDAVESPREQRFLMDELVGEHCEVSSGSCTPTQTPEQPLRRWDGLPSTARMDIFFSFHLETENNPYTGSGELDGQGIPPGFFADVHVRRAFEYCFDGEKYRQAVLDGTGQRARTVIAAGLPGYQPDAPGYDFDLQRCADEFKASTLTSADGRSLWETGFHMAIPYPTGNTPVQTLAQIWQQVLAQVNPKFVVSVTGISWQTYVSGQIARQLPLFYGRWQADIADPHNWVVPYVSGCFASRQSLPAELREKYLEITTRAAEEADPRARADLYAEFNRIFYENASALLLYQTAESIYLPRYVQNWSANPLLPGALNWYALSEE